MSRDAIMVSNTTADMRVTSERAMIFSAAWRAASATNADLVTWSRSAACEMSWSVASSMRSSRRRVFVVVMVIPPPITVRDLYGNCERGAAIVRTPRAWLCPRSYSRKVRQRPNASRAPYPLRPFRSPLTLVCRDLTRGLLDALRYSPRLRVCGGMDSSPLAANPKGTGTSRSSNRSLEDQPMLKRPPLWITVVAALAVGLSACGGGSDKAKTTPPQADSPTASAATTVIQSGGRFSIGWSSSERFDEREVPVPLG